MRVYDGEKSAVDFSKVRLRRHEARPYHVRSPFTDSMSFSFENPTTTIAEVIGS